ncbi:hypothetical protein [Tenacibaculum sp. Bg11-29]|uniref:hypothetical protein n=1 Tax=Tenacibaculum sp. Bg11-29 TaxID=2058306 RepID=UPI0012FECE23|nr:hypothetical protein [Tenacibaculum sp. Bg11-29]
MKKSILNIGKALNKAEQQTINGGYAPVGCYYNIQCLHEYGNDAFCDDGGHCVIG